LGGIFTPEQAGGSEKDRRAYPKSTAEEDLEAGAELKVAQIFEKLEAPFAHDA
jgi:hypothetical protein